MNPLLALLEGELRRRAGRPPVVPPAAVPDVGALLALARIAGERAGVTPYTARPRPRFPWEPKPAPPGYVEEAPAPPPPLPPDTLPDDAAVIGPWDGVGFLPPARPGDAAIRRLPETYGPDGQTRWDYHDYGPRPTPPVPPPPGSAMSAYAVYQRAWRQYERDLAEWERNRNGGTL